MRWESRRGKKGKKKLEVGVGKIEAKNYLRKEMSLQLRGLFSTIRGKITMRRKWAFTRDTNTTAWSNKKCSSFQCFFRRKLWPTCRSRRRSTRRWWAFTSLPLAMAFGITWPTAPEVADGSTELLLLPNALMAWLKAAFPYWTTFNYKKLFESSYILSTAQTNLTIKFARTGRTKFTRS